MQMLSDDDQSIRGMTSEELDAAWDLWFDLAQSTNAADPPYTHGVFSGPPRAPDGQQSPGPLGRDSRQRSAESAD